MYRSKKRLEHVISVAFRQWRAASHCKFLHGYALTVEVEFESDRLDSNNWVMDFGGLRNFRTALEKGFDHKLLVAHDDPSLPLFEMLDDKGIAEIVILDNISCECFAEAFHDLLTTSTELPEGVTVAMVTVSEHEGNSASFSQGPVRPFREIPRSDKVHSARTADRAPPSGYAHRRFLKGSPQAPGIDASAAVHVSAQDIVYRDYRGHSRVVTNHGPDRKGSM